MPSQYQLRLPRPRRRPERLRRPNPLLQAHASADEFGERPLCYRRRLRNFGHFAADARSRRQCADGCPLGACPKGTGHHIRDRSFHGARGARPRRPHRDRRSSAVRNGGDGIPDLGGDRHHPGRSAPGNRWIRLQQDHVDSAVTHRRSGCDANLEHRRSPLDLIPRVLSARSVENLTLFCSRSVGPTSVVQSQQPSGACRVAGLWLAKPRHDAARDTRLWFRHPVLGRRHPERRHARPTRSPRITLTSAGVVPTRDGARLVLGVRF